MILIENKFSGSLKFKSQVNMGFTIIGKMSSLGIGAALILMLSLAPTSDAESFLGDVFGTICAGISLLGNFDECSSAFRSYLGSNIRGSSAGRYDEGSTERAAYCCSVTALRNCVLKKIGSNCGNNVQDIADKVVNGIVKGTKLMAGGELPCHGDEIYYSEGSPLCWPDWGKY